MGARAVVLVKHPPPIRPTANGILSASSSSTGKTGTFPNIPSAGNVLFKNYFQENQAFSGRDPQDRLAGLLA